MSQIVSHQIVVPKTAHYYTIGTPSPRIKKLWIVCHGYGQLGSSIIRKFNGLDDGHTLVIAPEGLSRFYWKGVTGVVAASWMTKKDRLEEIADYANYLQTIYDQYVPQLAPDVKIYLLGFSQGVATQVRWIMAKQPRFNHLIMWGGLLPEDLDYRPMTDYFLDKQLHWIYGMADEFLKPEYLSWHRGFWGEMGLEVSETTFKGKHEILRGVLEEFVIGLG